MESEQNNSDLNNIDSLNQNISNSNIKTVKQYTHNDKKILVKRIGDIKNKRCYLKIFKIIHGDNFKYTKNDNGIFFNLTNLPDIILSNIDTIVQYYEAKKSHNELLLIQNLNNNSSYDYNHTDDSIYSEIISDTKKIINNTNNTNNI